MSIEIQRNWTFERTDIAQEFDRHVREQLPWYDLATGALAHIARHYIPADGLVYDIGASTGNIGRSINDVLEDRKARLIGLEASREMCERYAGPGICLHKDALEFDFDPFDVGIMFLTLMFMPIGRRRNFLLNLEDQLNPGGALIIVDKLEGGSGYLSTIMRRLTLAGKVATGTASDQIIAKELSLAGVQRPITERFIPTLFPNAYEFFRFGEFVGYVVEKS